MAHLIPEQLEPFELSQRNRNVRIFTAVRMSGVMGMSLRPFERLAPRMILGWTFRALTGIVGLAVGRIGLRRSATRAPAGRLYARGPGLLLGVSVLFFNTGVGRQCAKLRGFGGRD